MSGTARITEMLYEIRYRRKPLDGDASHNWISGTKLYRPLQDAVAAGVPIVAVHRDPFERVRSAYHRWLDDGEGRQMTTASFREFCERLGAEGENGECTSGLESQVKWLGVDKGIFAATLGYDHLEHLPSVLHHLTGRRFPAMPGQKRNTEFPKWESGLKKLLEPVAQPDFDAGWDGVTPESVMGMFCCAGTPKRAVAGTESSGDGIDTSRFQSVAKWGWYRGNPQVWRRWLSSQLPTKVLEIGAFDGVSANTMLDALFTHAESTVDAIDPYLPDPTTPLVSAATRGVFQENRRRGGHAERIHLHEGKSRDVLAGMLAEGRGECYDLVYVDGGHTAPDVLSDAVLAWPLLKPGGALVFDDYKWGEGRLPTLRPREGVDAFESAFARELIPVHRGYQRMYRKVGIPGGLRTSAGEPYEGQIVIVGAYNSGSSLLSAMMECLGFDIGRPTWEDFGESASFRKILVEAFDEKRVMRTMDRGKLVSRLVEWVAQIRPYSGTLCVKHPLTGMFLPEIQEAFGEKTVFLRILRPIEDSIRKLAARRWFPEPEKLQKLVQSETEGFFASGTPYVTVEHGRLLADPAGALGSLAAELNLEASPHRIEMATRLVRRRGSA